MKGPEPTGFWAKASSPISSTSRLRHDRGNEGREVVEESALDPVELDHEGRRIGAGGGLDGRAEAAVWNVDLVVGEAVDRELHVLAGDVGAVREFHARPEGEGPSL